MDHTKFILKSLEEIDSGTCNTVAVISNTSLTLFLIYHVALATGDAEGSLRQAEQLMKTVHELAESDVPNRLEFIASLHSCIGNAHLELGDSDLALKHHLDDLKIAEEQ